MVQDFHSSRYFAAGWRNRSSRYRVLMLALAITLVLGSPEQLAQAAPSSDTIWILPKLQASPSTITLCPNESAYVYVTYREDQYRASNLSAPVQGQPVSGVTITGTVAPPTNVAHLVKATTTTQTWRAGITALFRIRAGSNFGRTTIRFEAEDILTPLLGPNIVFIPPTPITVDVQVKCEYSVMALSYFVLPGERQLYTFGVLTIRVTPDDIGNFSNIPATMNSHAFWVGGCAGTSTIQPSGADITGHIRDGKFTAVINYQSANANTTEGCMGKSAPGPGQPEPFPFQVSARGGTTTQPHNLDTYVMVAGTTSVSVIPLP